MTWPLDGARPSPELMLTYCQLGPHEQSCILIKIQLLSFKQREREIKFIGLFEDRGHRGPYSPYKLFNHNLYIGIIIFPHIDNPQSTGYN